AHPGQVALVQQRLAERPVRLGGQPAHRLVRVPVRAEQVWPEVADQGVLPGGLHQGEVVHPVADARPRVVGQHGPDLGRGPPTPIAPIAPAALSAPAVPAAESVPAVSDAPVVPAVPVAPSAPVVPVAVDVPAVWDAPVVPAVPVVPSAPVVPVAEI